MLYSLRQRNSLVDQRSGADLLQLQGITIAITLHNEVVDCGFSFVLTTLSVYVSLVEQCLSNEFPNVRHFADAKALHQSVITLGRRSVLATLSLEKTPC